MQKPYFYVVKTILLDDENMAFVSLKHRDSYAVAIFLNANNIFIVKWYCFFTIRRLVTIFREICR